jgi:hypothetical protein
MFPKKTPSVSSVHEHIGIKAKRTFDNYFFLKSEFMKTPIRDGKTNIIQKLIRLPDPLFVLLHRKLKVKPGIGAISIGVIQVFVWWLVDAITKSKFLDSRIIHVTDLDEFSFGLFLWGIFVPILWWYYLSWPNLLEKTISSLCEYEVVDCKLVKDEMEKQQKYSFTFIAFWITLIVLALYFFNSMPTEIGEGKLSFWFVSWWGKTVLGIFIGVNAYIFVMFVLKALEMIFRLRNFFKRVGVKSVYVLHVDKCGGFGVIGSLAMRLSSLAVLVGV